MAGYPHPYWAMMPLPTPGKPHSLMSRLAMRFRWWVAAPVLRPILREWEESAENARRAAKASGAPRDWQIECIARSELSHVHAMEVEKAFGCTSFDAMHHYIRHYS